MTSSVRGLFVGGKSTGNTNRQSSQRTAPIATSQGSAAPLQADEIQAPTLSPQASMQAAVLQAERQDSLKSIRFPQYIPPPQPNDDLRQLAKSLGTFSTSLGALTEAGIEFGKQREEEAKEHAQALAAQGFAYGPFADYAELTRNLERVSNDPNRTEDERNRAELLLSDLKARANRIRPHIDSQARILRVRQNALSLGVAASRNPVIGQNPDGSDLYLNDLAADDPRYISWQNSYIYGDVQLTPAEFKEVSGVVQQATINDMSRQNTQKVKRDEQLYVTSHAQRMNELGFQHFQPKEGVRIGLRTMREDIQALIDDPRFLGLSADAQKKALDALFSNYLAGARRAGAAQHNINDVLEVFYSVDKDGNESGVFVGPRDQRDINGKANTALLWRYTQAADWDVKTEESEESNNVQRASTQDKADALAAEQKYSEQIDAALDLLGSSATKAEAYKNLDDIKAQITADPELSVGAKAVAIKKLDEKFENYNEALYRTLLDKTKADLQDEIGQGIKTYAQLRTQIRDEAAAGNLRPRDEIALLKQLDGSEDPTVKAAQLNLKNQVNNINAQVTTRSEQGYLTPQNRGIVLGHLATYRAQFNQITQDYLNNDIDAAQYQQRTAALQIDPEALRLLQGAQSFATTDVEFQSYRTNQQSGAVENIDVRQLNGALMNSRAPDRLARVYSSQTDRAFEFDTIVRMTQGFYGQDTKGYNYNVLKNQLAKVDIEPIDFLISEHEKAIAQALLYVDDPATAEQLEQMQTTLQLLRGTKASLPRQVSSINPSTAQAKLVAARDNIGGLLQSLFIAPASAQTLDMQPPPLPPINAEAPAAVAISPGSKQQAILKAAERVGVDPASLAAIMSFETGGTFDPRARNSLGYIGLIQFGDWEQKNYRVNRNTPFEEQAAAAAQFLIDRGVKPGDTIREMYAAVLIGNAAGRLSDGSDGMNTKDAYGTSVNKALGELSPGGAHYKKAVRFLKGA
tara:strand:+ start:467 stop:3388 length:2922 start_codon:yes stop_codon:yes gene_type:complete